MLQQKLEISYGCVLLAETKNIRLPHRRTVQKLLHLLVARISNYPVPVLTTFMPNRLYSIQMNLQQAVKAQKESSVTLLFLQPHR